MREPVRNQESLKFVETTIVEDQQEPAPIGAQALNRVRHSFAKWVGPSTYVSDTTKNVSVEGTMYIDAPVPNVLRSTTEPGAIRVSVSAPGLAPNCNLYGRLTIRSEGSPSRHW